MNLPPIMLGSRILHVEDNGCMAESEENQCWGKVHTIARRVLPGGGQEYEIAFVDFGRLGNNFQVPTYRVVNCQQGYPVPDETRGFVWHR